MVNIKKLRKEKMMLEKKLSKFRKMEMEKRKLEMETDKLKKDIKDSKTELRLNVEGKFKEAKRQFQRAKKNPGVRATLKSVRAFGMASEKLFRAADKASRR